MGDVSFPGTGRERERVGCKSTRAKNYALVNVSLCNERVIS